MRNIIKFTIAFMLAVAAGSCSFINLEPVSEIPESQMWKNQRDVNAGIAEIYSSFRTALRSNWFSWGEIRPVPGTSVRVQEPYPESDDNGSRLHKLVESL